MEDIDDTRATPAPDLEITEHVYRKSRPEDRAISTFNTGDLTSNATPGQLPEQCNPSPGVQDTIPEITKLSRVKNRI